MDIRRSSMWGYINWKRFWERGRWVCICFVVIDNDMYWYLI